MACTPFRNGLYTIQPWPVHHSEMAWTPFSHGLYTIQKWPVHHSVVACTPFSNGLYTIQPSFSHSLYTIQQWPVQSIMRLIHLHNRNDCVLPSAPRKKQIYRSSPPTAEFTHLGLFTEAQVDEAGAQLGQQLQLIHPHNRPDCVSLPVPRKKKTQI